MGYTLEVRQRITVLQNRYDISRMEGSGSASLAYAEQKRIALREKITFFAAGSSAPAFMLTARNVFELVGTYDITDANGAVLATLQKDPIASIARSTYHLTTPDGTLRGRERTWWRPIARRVLSDLPWLLPLQFDFTDSSGRVVFAVDRQLRLRDLYRVSVHDDRVDWRVAATCAVAVDALMDR